MPQVQEIADEEHELTFARVAAVDVGKQSGMVCLRLPSRSGSGSERTCIYSALDLSRDGVSFSRPGSTMVDAIRSRQLWLTA